MFCARVPARVVTVTDVGHVTQKGGRSILAWSRMSGSTMFFFFYFVFLLLHVAVTHSEG